MAGSRMISQDECKRNCPICDKPTLEKDMFGVLDDEHWCCKECFIH